MKTPKLTDQIKELKRLGNWLEEYQPWLSRQVLSAASNITDPYLAGMGLHLRELTETRAEVSLPLRWKNRGEDGFIHVGALTTAAEHVSRLYWERLLNLQRHQLRAKQIAARFLSEATSDCKVVFTITEGEREALLFKLRAEGSAQLMCPVTIFDQAGRLIAELQVEWSFTQPKMLGGTSKGD